MIRTRKFGDAGEEVTELGLGTWALGGVGYGAVSEKDALDVMDYAYESGIRFFDTADFYGFGESEFRIGKFLQSGKIKDLKIATKGGLQFNDGPVRKSYTQSYLSTALDASLNRLKTNSIFLYQLHGPNLDKIKEGECLEFLRDAKRSGKIRFAGVSLYNPLDALPWMETGEIDCVQVPYNLIDVRFETIGAEVQKKKKAVIVREALAFGFLTGKYTVDSTFEKDDHRRRYVREEKEKILGCIEKIQKEKDWSREELFRQALPHCLKLREASTVLVGVKNSSQLEEHVANYQFLRKRGFVQDGE